MFLAYYLFAYVSIVLGAVLSHVFVGNYLRQFPNKVEYSVRYWTKAWKRCQKHNTWCMPKRKLKRITKSQKMIALHQFLEAFSEQERSRFLYENRLAVIEIVQQMKSKTKKAYFAYMLSTLCVSTKNVGNVYGELMLQFIVLDSIFLRENALKALYHLGNPQMLQRAFSTLSQNSIYHSEKLISDGLAAYDSDKQMLIHCIMKEFEHYNDCYKLALVNYLNYYNEHTYDEILIDYLDSKKTSTDLNCSILRLIGKQVNEDNKNIILKYISQCVECDEWEAVAVAAGVLGNFPKEERLTEVLLQGLTSRNWYIRKNSAKSLCKHGLSQAELTKIENGQDQYAKDAIIYELTNA